MNYLNYARRLEYLLELIKKGKLTSPKQLSSRFDCDEKTIRNMINVLRDSGDKIRYCRKMKRYILDE